MQALPQGGGTMSPDLEGTAGPLRCDSCGCEQNPVQAMLGAVCGECARANHYAANGKLYRRKCCGKRGAL